MNPRSIQLRGQPLGNSLGAHISAHITTSVLDMYNVFGDSDMRYRYPRHTFPKRDNEDLSITLHGDNIVDVYSKQSIPIEALASFQGYSLVSLVLTPVRPEQHQRMPRSLGGITQLRYEKHESKLFGDGTFAVNIGSSSSGLAANQWTANMVEKIFGYLSGTPQNSKIRRLLKDMEAHRAMDADIFVTEDQDALAFRDWIQNHMSVFILNLYETLDYLDVHLKRHGKYLGTPHVSITGRRGYYWERLCELIPALPKTWTASIVAEKTLLNGEQIVNYTHSLYIRLIYMLETKDRIASAFYQKADNETQHEMLREINYFVALATGAFDALAWLLRYFYSFCPNDSEEDPKLRQRIVLKLRSKQSTNGLISHVEAQNKILGSFLRRKDTQNLMTIFYPSRDSMQHRHPLSGIQYVRAVARPAIGHLSPEEKDTAYNLAILDTDTERAIANLDSDDPSDYFTFWGVRKLHDVVFLEPYKFVVQALRKLALFYEHALQSLDIYNSSSLSESDVTRINQLEQERFSKRADFVIPFLLNRTLPPISPTIPRMPGSGHPVSGEAKSEESMALYGVYTVFVELL